jgi:lysozyme
MNIIRLMSSIEKHEGRISHAYTDSEGYLTIGVGRLIDKRKGGHLSHSEIDMLLQNDVIRVVNEAHENIHFFNALTDSQQESICEMIFQLGISGVMKFKRMLSALEDENGEEAYKEALDSKWARQTPERAREVAEGLK